tara:strand:- start:541 stop:663 length:123 start_codon:yes stop_codon:yes gene_type:complete
MVWQLEITDDKNVEAVIDQKHDFLFCLKASVRFMQNAFYI